VQVSRHVRDGGIDQIGTEHLLGQRMVPQPSQGVQAIEAAQQVGDCDQLLAGVRRDTVLAHVGVVVFAQHLVPALRREGPERAAVPVHGPDQQADHRGADRVVAFLGRRGAEVVQRVV